MNNKIVSFSIIEKYLVKIQFQDGFESEINLKKFIGKGFTEELLKKDKFNKLYIEEGGGLAWPNGFDICPNFLRELVEKNSSDKISA